MSKRPLRGLALSGRPGWLVAYSLAFGFVSQTALAQAGSNSTQSQGTSTPQAQTSTQIKEVTVTAERRRQNLQKVAATVAVITGAEILSQGKITTTQILEDVPNVVVGPEGDIAVRGVETPISQSGGVPPTATATYVDDVFGGIGGDFDINRVEVLYGPQGTLYGRSATGGVVAFHTNDPELGKFGGTFSGEYGTADLRQAILAVNIPVLPQIALRVAAREFDQDGYFGNSRGGSTRTQEARTKVLYQPLSNLSFIGAWTIDEQHTGSGGWSPGLVGPNTFDYTAEYIPPVIAESRYHQYSGTAKYDFGYGTATYIGAYYDYDSTTDLVRGFNQVSLDASLNPLYQTQTQELRIASDPGSPLTWLVGANFYANMYKMLSDQTQLSALLRDGAPDTTPGIAGALISTQGINDRIFDYGLFTEETYSILPNLRITGGGRVDETKVTANIAKTINIDVDSSNNALLPDDNISGALTSTEIFRNFTYKVRAEYDLAPAHMAYASISTGFLPGEQELAVVSSNASGATFEVLPYTQELLTAYEIGSKNRFLDNSLQIDGDLYYEHYSGYQFAVNPDPNIPGGDDQVLLAVPLDIAGAELNVQWQFTPNDRLGFSGGITDAQVPGHPYVNGLGYVSSFMQRRLPGVIPDQFTVSYNHTITFPDGSTLAPRAQARFYGAYNVSSLTTAEIQFGEAPYGHQAATVVGDVDLDWTSANGKYSVGGYIRNIANNVYKTGISQDSNGISAVGVTLSNPRTAGMIVTAKF